MDRGPWVGHNPWGHKELDTSEHACTSKISLEISWLSSTYSQIHTLYHLCLNSSVLRIMCAIVGDARKSLSLCVYTNVCVWLSKMCLFYNYSEYGTFSVVAVPFCSSWVSLVGQTVKNLPAMQETRVWSLGREDPLEEEMATHSSILAWKIPWTAEPGRLPFTGLQRVGHDWMRPPWQCRRLQSWTRLSDWTELMSLFRVNTHTHLSPLLMFQQMHF